jgi:hypothetical protein
MGVGGQRYTTAALPPEKDTVSHFIGGWIRPKNCLDRCGESQPHRYSIPEPFFPVPSLYTVCAIPDCSMWEQWRANIEVLYKLVVNIYVYRHRAVSNDAWTEARDKIIRLTNTMWLLAHGDSYVLCYVVGTPVDILVFGKVSWHYFKMLDDRFLLPSWIRG